MFEEKNENTYLVFHSTVDEIREVLTKYTELWNGIKEHWDNKWQFKNRI